MLHVHGTTDESKDLSLATEPGADTKDVEIAAFSLVFQTCLDALLTGEALSKGKSMSWEIDAIHSHVMFSIRHVMVSIVRGRFNVLSGHMHIDEEHPELSWVDAQVDAASIDTQNEQRDAHLRNADFFETDKYPQITFKSTQVEAKGDQEYKVIGDLTIHGVTKQVTFDAEYNGQNSMMGGPRTGLAAKTKISRKDFDLTFGSVAEAGNVALSNTVTIEIDLEVVQQVAKAHEEAVAQ